MFNVQSLAQLIKVMIARGLALTAGEEPVGELFAVVEHDFLHIDRKTSCEALRKELAAAAVLLLLI